jgi:hypothetical protein
VWYVCTSVYLNDEQRATESARRCTDQALRESTDDLTDDLAA